MTDELNEIECSIQMCHDADHNSIMYTISGDSSRILDNTVTVSTQYIGCTTLSIRGIRSKCLRVSVGEILKMSKLEVVKLEYVIIIGDIGVLLHEESSIISLYMKCVSTVNIGDSIRCKNLSVLSISQCNVDNDGQLVLDNLQRLERIYIDTCKDLTSICTDGCINLAEGLIRNTPYRNNAIYCKETGLWTEIHGY